MNRNYQIFNVESLTDLFLDCRLLIKQRKILIFVLNATPYPTQLEPRLKRALANRHLTVEVLDLTQTKNDRLYRKLSITSLVGYGITHYDTLIVPFLISQLANQQPVTTAQLRKLSAHLYYLDCTNQSPVKALMKYPDALKIRQSWLRHENFIDLKDYVKKVPLNLAGANNGLAIHYHRPMDHLRSQKQFNHYLAFSLGELLTIYDLAKRPAYREAIQARKRLIKAIKALHPELSINLSTPLASLVKAMLHTSTPVPKVISYRIPDVTRNLLDGTLRWTRKMDERYHFNRQLTRHFLPVYNYYKNLQGRTVNQRDLTSPNLNLPFVKPNGKLTVNWLKLGKRMTSPNVSLSKLKKATRPHLFVQSQRSGNWLINRKYRAHALPSNYQIDLSSLRVRFLTHLGLISPDLPALPQRITTLLINLGPSRKVPLAIRDQFASAQIMWQLLLWQTGERLTLNGCIISRITVNGIRLAKRPATAPDAPIPASFPFLLKPSFKDPILEPIPHPTQSQRFHKIQQMRKQLLDPQHFTTALRFFQIIPKVGPWSHQILFTKDQSRAIRNLGTVTRIFLVKPHPTAVTIHVAKVTHANWYRYNNDVDYHNHLINQVEQNGVNGHVRKLRPLGSTQSGYVNQRALKNFSLTERRYLYHQLDLKAYLEHHQSTEP